MNKLWVKKVISENGLKQVLYQCDDRNGYALSISRSRDGDLWISIEPDQAHENIDVNCQRISGNVRIRMPMIGGGMHEKLYLALAEILMCERDTQ